MSMKLNAVSPEQNISDKRNITKKIPGNEFMYIIITPCVHVSLWFVSVL